MHASESRRSENRQTLTPLEASQQASCFWCERTHASKHLLSVCPSCAESIRLGRLALEALAMDRPHPSTLEAIDERLTRKSPRRAPLALDIAARGRVGCEVGRSYTRFTNRYAAFAKEWRNYDDFEGSDGLDDTTPPARLRAALEESRMQAARS